MENTVKKLRRLAVIIGITAIALSFCTNAYNFYNALTELQRYREIGLTLSTVLSAITHYITSFMVATVQAGILIFIALNADPSKITAVFDKKDKSDTDEG